MLLDYMGLVKMVEILNTATPFLILTLWCLFTYWIVDIL